MEALDLSEFTFHTVKSVNLKNTFSLTSHIAVYETCALQYKFYKELEFMPIRQGVMLFGTLVHETIEDVHRAALRNETEKITKEILLVGLTATIYHLSKLSTVIWLKHNVKRL